MTKEYMYKMKREDNKFPKFCRTNPGCKLFSALPFPQCKAGYKNPPTTEVAVINQKKHHGELPCIYNPMRQSKRQLPTSIAVIVGQKPTM